jgi:hypothetical protein
LTTKDHFSSNCTSRVCGGKSHELVVEVEGVAARLEGQAADGVRGDARQAAGLADADPLLEVGEDGKGFLLGEATVKQGGPLPLAEAMLAGAAGEVTPLLGGAVAEGDAEVAQTPLAIVSTVGILAAEVLEFVHGSPRPKNKRVVAVTLPLG